MSSRRSSVPRHVSGGVGQLYYKMPVNLNPGSIHKKTHPADKYSPSSYLSTLRDRIGYGAISPLSKTQNVSLNQSAKSNKFQTLTYEYELHIRNSIQFPSQQFARLTNIVNKYQPKENPHATADLSRSQQISPEKKMFTRTSEKLPEIKSSSGCLSPLNNTLGYSQIKELRNALGRTAQKNLNITDIQGESELVKNVIKENEKELKNIFNGEIIKKPYPSPPSSPEANDQEADAELKKKNMRRKWGRIQKRNIFKFDIDLVNDSVKVVRTTKSGEDEIEEEKVVKRTIPDAVSTISPYLQKRKIAHDHYRKNSILVFYDIREAGAMNEDDPPKSAEKEKRSARKNAGGATFTQRNMFNLEEFWKNMKIHDSPKMQSKIEKLFSKSKQILNVFDLGLIDIIKLDPASLLLLYNAVKSAVTINLYSINPPELNKLDPDTFESSPITEHDKEMIEKYKSYVTQAEYNEIFSGFWAQKRSNRMKPVCREGMGYVTVGKRGYIFGGYGGDKLNDLWCLSSGSSYEWTLIQPIGKSIPEKRFGHCIATYKNKIYIHAGGGEFVAAGKVRQSYSDLWAYSIEDNSWSELPRDCVKNVKSPLRRINAASALLEHLWFIHGGYDGILPNTFSEITAYDMEKQKFVEIIMQGASMKNRLPPMIGHSMISVMPDWVKRRPENVNYWTNLNKWKFVASDTMQATKLGIYVFGGFIIDGQDYNNNEYNSNIYLIKCNPTKTMQFAALDNKKDISEITRYVIDIEKIVCTGNGPCPRSHQSTLFFKNKFIAVFGGKNSQQLAEPDSHCLNDLYLLDLEKYEWVPVAIYGFLPSPRWSQAMLSMDNKDRIVVFGGITDQRYCSYNVYVLETDPILISKHLLECRKTKSAIEREANLIGRQLMGETAKKPDNRRRGLLNA